VGSSLAPQDQGEKEGNQERVGTRFKIPLGALSGAKKRSREKLLERSNNISSYSGGGSVSGREGEIWPPAWGGGFEKLVVMCRTGGSSQQTH